MRTFALAACLALCAAACGHQVEMSKPGGMNKAQWERDLRECGAQAESGSKTVLRNASDRQKVHNRIYLQCMRTRGYEVVDQSTRD